MRFLQSLIRKLSYFLSITSILFIGLAFTDIPYYAYHRLGVVEQKLKTAPDYLILMGGDGMPSPSGLMRTYFGVQLAKKYPYSKIILALPKNETDSTYQLELMKKEFTENSIAPRRIEFAAGGYNTRTQALEIKSMIPAESKLLIITSPEHTFRAIASFKKVGFHKVGGSPTFEKPPDEDALDKEDEKDSRRIRNLDLRYNIWSYMQYEIIVFREYLAIAYYWIKGWI